MAFHPGRIAEVFRHRRSVNKIPVSAVAQKPYNGTSQVNRNGKALPGGMSTAGSRLGLPRPLQYVQMAPLHANGAYIRSSSAGIGKATGKRLACLCLPGRASITPKASLCQDGSSIQGLIY